MSREERRGGGEERGGQREKAKEREGAAMPCGERGVVWSWF